SGPRICASVGRDASPVQPMTRRRPPRFFAPPDIEAERRPDGELRLRSRVALHPPSRAVGLWLQYWAEEAPERCFLAERTESGAWRRLSYGEAHRQARAVGEALLQRDLDGDRPVAILSENGIDHALLTLGAMQAGIPAAPISPAYSRLSKDFAKLRYIVDLLRPGLVYAADGALYSPALDAIGRGDAELVVS